VKKVIVTGATGFVGHAVLPLLNDRGFEVHVVSRAGDKRASKDPAQPLHRTDLFNRQEVTQLLDSVKPTHLLHLAWITTPGKYLQSTENLLWLQHSLFLVESFAAAGGKRTVITGTCLEYDLSDGVLDEESTPLRPATPYGAAKLGLHTALQQSAADLGISVGWARLFFLYGPYERPERLVPYVISQLLKGEPAEVTAGRQERDYLHVRDAAEAITAFLDADDEGALNVGSGRTVPVGRIVDTVGDIIGRPDLISRRVRSGSEEEAAVIQADITRLRRLLDWSPSIDLEEGLRETVEWWRKNPA